MRSGGATGISELQACLQKTLPMGQIEVVAVPGCAPIKLGLISADFPTGPLPPEVMRDVIANPAYWAFCWGSGLALARFLLADPAWVAGKSVVDLGSGSGIVAIAAALAGAAQVTACDTDADARAATAANAAINQVTIDVRATLPESRDILLMADVLYDKQNLPLLALAQSRSARVLIADTRIKELPDPSYREVAQLEAFTYPNLGEFDEFRTAHIFSWSRQAQQQ